MREQHRDARSFLWPGDLRRDLAYGVRTLRRTPAFTAVAIATLALGIGAVTVIYSVLRNVVLDPFPYSRSDRMVNVVLLDASGRVFRGPYFPSLLIGIAASLATNRLLESQLWNTSRHDAATFAAVILAVVAIALVACWVPARRAVRVEPMIALRHE